jgi:hypothetical protein
VSLKSLSTKAGGDFLLLKKTPQRKVLKITDHTEEYGVFTTTQINQQETPKLLD